MNNVEKFFEKFGLPSSWIVDGDICINENDSNEWPQIDDGDEVNFTCERDDISSCFWDVTIHEDTITVRGKSQVTTELVTVTMAKKDQNGNIEKMIMAINEAKDAERAFIDPTQ